MYLKVLETFSIFFQKCYIINYIHKEELKGEIQWLTCDFSKEKEPFNFHINYSSGFWYPLDDYGMLPHVDPQGFVKFDDVYEFLDDSFHYQETY